MMDAVVLIALLVILLATALILTLIVGWKH